MSESLLTCLAPAASSPRPSPRSSGHGPPAKSPSYLYLYLPYLHFDTYVSMIRRRNLIRRRLKHGRARPVPKDIADLDSLEARVIWQYLAFDPPLNYRRTLDQFGNPAMRSTYEKDDDQFLYKLTKKNGPDPLAAAAASPAKIVTGGKRGSVRFSIMDTHTLAPAAGSEKKKNKEEPDVAEKTDSDSDASDFEIEESEYKNGTMLMIDQLWLWAIDKGAYTARICWSYQSMVAWVIIYGHIAPRSSRTWSCRHLLQVPASRYLGSL